MVAYEIYYRDKTDNAQLVGILPERRKRAERITKDSVLNWGWQLIGDHPGVSNIYFVQVEMLEAHKSVPQWSPRK